MEHFLKGIAALRHSYTSAKLPFMSILDGDSSLPSMK